MGANTVLNEYCVNHFGYGSVAITSHIAEIFIHCGAIPVICVLMVKQHGGH